MFDLRYLGKFTRLSVLVLAIEWTVFGSMHFSMTKETVEMLPNFLYPIGIPIVVITGILEVATGILILIPEVRRRAAMGSIALLILLLPAMYAILANQSGDASAFETAFRVPPDAQQHLPGDLLGASAARAPRHARGGDRRNAASTPAAPG